MFDYQQPDASGHFGRYGGSFASETLTFALQELKDAYARYQHDPDFEEALQVVAAEVLVEQQVALVGAVCKVVNDHEFLVMRP